MCYMKSSKRISVFVIIMIKLVVSAVITCVPSVMEFCYPFALFTPLFLLALAYGGTSKWVAGAILAVIALMTVTLFVFPILLLVKRQNIKWVTIVLQVFTILEAVCLGISFFMGGFFRKFLGVILNVITAALLSEIRQVEKYST